jgi:hypothetical protein
MDTTCPLPLLERTLMVRPSFFFSMISHQSTKTNLLTFTLFVTQELLPEPQNNRILKRCISPDSIKQSLDHDLGLKTTSDFHILLSA